MSSRITSLLRSATAALLGLALLAGMGDAARADLISFDPDGPGGVTGPYSISGFDWAVGNALANDVIPTTVGQTFQLYYQAALQGLLDANGSGFQPTGLNSAYEITVVASITQVITGVVGNSITFAVAPNQVGSYLEIWQGAVNRNTLAGTGFNDGTRILTGTPLPTGAGADAGAFALALDPGGNPLIQDFDQFSTQNYPGQASVVGDGSSVLGFRVTGADSQYFLTAPLILEFSNSNTVPFTRTNPSRLFVDQPNGAPPSLVPNLGPINGFPVGPGTDFQFQSDGSTRIIIPEPASLSLLGLGLLGLAGARRRSRRRASA